MSHVFLSYVHEDARFTSGLLGDLERRGVFCWMDHTAAGAARPWRDDIAEAIRKCTAFVIVLSPQSAASDAVNRELAYAASLGRRIVPVVYRPVDLPAAIQHTLGNVEWAHFDNAVYEEALAKLTPALLLDVKPPETQRPASVWVISAAYVLAGLNFLASFGTCAGHVILRPYAAHPCLEGLSVSVFGLVLINALLVLTIGAGILVFLQKRTALATLGIHLGILVLVTVWAFVRGRYGIGFLVGAVLSTAALAYIANSNRQGKSAPDRRRSKPQ